MITSHVHLAAQGGGGVKPYCLRLSLRQSAIGTYCVGLDIIMMAFFYAHYFFFFGSPRGGFKPPKPPPPRRSATVGWVNFKGLHDDTRSMIMIVCKSMCSRVQLSNSTNSMTLVSFFSEDNVLSNEIKICYIFEYQSNENRAFRFFGTPDIGA